MLFSVMPVQIPSGVAGFDGKAPAAFLFTGAFDHKDYDDYEYLFQPDQRNYLKLIV